MKTLQDLVGDRELRAVRTDIAHPFDSSANGVALDLDDFTVFVFEDPSDGYRSNHAEPLFSSASLYSFGVSPDYIRAPVLIQKWNKRENDYGEPDGIEFIDKRNGKVILTLGTDNSDDYYPSFKCEWVPSNLAENSK